MIFRNPGETRVYQIYAKEEGTFSRISNPADPVMQVEHVNSPSVRYGLFGAVNVQPVGAEWYRSQVTRRDLHLASFEVTTPSLRSRWWTIPGYG